VRGIRTPEWPATFSNLCGVLRRRTRNVRVAYANSAATRRVGVCVSKLASCSEEQPASSLSHPRRCAALRGLPVDRRCGVASYLRKTNDSELNERLQPRQGLHNPEDVRYTRLPPTAPLRNLQGGLDFTPSSPTSLFEGRKRESTCDPHKQPLANVSACGSVFGGWRRNRTQWERLTSASFHAMLAADSSVKG